MEMAKLKCASPPKFRGKSFLLAKEKDICTAGTVSENAIYLTAFGRKKPGKRLILALEITVDYCIVLMINPGSFKVSV